MTTLPPLPAENEDPWYAKRAAWDAAVESELARLAAVPGAVAGTIVPFGGPAVPVGWLSCDGTAVSRTTYPALFAAIGTTYGVGDGSTTFNVPNFKGRTLVGQDPAQPEFDALGEGGGAKTHTLTQTEMPSHRHGRGTIITGGAPVNPGSQLGSSSGAVFYSNTGSGFSADSGGTDLIGGGGAHNNLQPYAVTRYIIATGIGAIPGEIGVIAQGTGITVTGVGTPDAPYVVALDPSGPASWDALPGIIPAAKLPDDIAVHGVGGIPVALPNDPAVITAHAELQRAIALNAAPAELQALQAATFTAEGIEPGDPWRQPTGAHDAYPLAAEVSHNGRGWESTIAANVWEPGVYGWEDTTPEPGIPAWVQPTGAHDAYLAGDIVTHDGQVWQSDLDGNVWEPGVHGWTPLDPEPGTE